MRRLVAVVLAGVLLASCSRFERRGADDGGLAAADPAGQQSTTIAPPNDDLASGVSSKVPPPVTEPLSSPPTRDDRAARTPVTGRTVVRSGAANRSVVDHPGWRVALTVGDRGDYASDDTVPIEVVLTNTAPHTRHHEVDQPDSVVITTQAQPGRRAWSHLECNPTLSVYEQSGGLRAIEPDTSVAMIVRYPLTDDCRLPPGDYLVFGQWSVCPDDARQETPNPGTFVCAEGRAVLVDAGPVRLVLR